MQERGIEMNRSEELDALMAKYPEFSPILILKIALSVYGAVITEKALERIQKDDLAFSKGDPYGISFDIRKKEFYLPGPVLFRDGTCVFINYGEPYEDPFTIDYDAANDVFLVLYRDEPIDVIGFVPRPAFFGHTTSKGTLMDTVGGTGTSQRLLFNAYQRCRFWEEKNQCHYCALFTSGKYIREVDPEDAKDTLLEALKEPGRFTDICVSGGSDFGGDPPFSTEVVRYKRFMKTIGEPMAERFNLHLMAPAYPKEVLQELHDETGMTMYRANIEVWDPKHFRRLCPGKEKWIGYEEWVRRLCDAVDVFGPGKVYTSLVVGAELAQPDGFASTDEALESNLECCRFMTEHGIYSQMAIWRPHRREVLGWQPMQKAEYYMKVAEGFHKIRREGMGSVSTSWLRSGDMPDCDLMKADLAENYTVRNTRSHYAIEADDYVPGAVSGEIREFLTQPGLRLFAEVSEECGQSYLPAFDGVFGPDRISLPDVTADSRILLPLFSDCDALSAYLAKKIWFREPLTLLAAGPASDTALRLTVRVFREHVVGSLFTSALLHVRSFDPKADMAAVCELHLLQAEKINGAVLSGLRILENRDGGSLRHLDRQMR